MESRAPDLRSFLRQASTWEQGLTFGGRAALLSIWWLPIMPTLWALLFPTLSSPFTAPALGISDASRTEIAVLALFALGCSGWRPDLRAIRWSDSGLWLALFVFWTAVSSLTSPEQIGSLLFSQSWLAAACLYVAVPRLCPPRLSLGQRLWLLHLPVVAVCILALGDAQLRVAGPFQLPGALANWLLLVSPLLFREYLQKSARTSALAALPAALAFLTVLLTVSRAAYLVLWFQIICLLLLEADRSLRWFRSCALFWGVSVLGLALFRSHLSGVGLLAAVAVVGAAPLVLVSIQRKLSGSLLVKTALLLGVVSIAFAPASQWRQHESQSSFVVHRWDGLAGSDNSAISRIEFWRAGLMLAVKHPIQGVGPGRYGEAYPQVQTKYYYYSDSAHSAGIELLAELGFVGAGLLLLALGLELRRLQLRPEKKPWQRGLLLGAASGIFYAQFEIGYHFAYLWASLALLMSFLVPRKTIGQPLSSRAAGLVVAWSLACLLLGPLAGQRQYEISQREINVAGAYRTARQVADRYPHWSAPVLSALSYGLQVRVDPNELEPLVQRALRCASETAVTYKFAGDVAYDAARYFEAKAYYQKALQLDRFNFPGSYHGLLLIAEKMRDPLLKKQVEDQILARYDLSLLKFAHTGHKNQLMKELGPLLYDLADGLSPYQNPSQTEPIYRFLLSEYEDDARALHGLGISLWMSGRQSQAWKYLERAHQLNEYYPLPVAAPQDS